MGYLHSVTRFLPVPAVALVAATVLGTAAGAATCTGEFGGGSNVQTTEFELTPAAEPAACYDRQNATVDNVNDAAVFGYSDWMLADKTDESGDGSVLSFTTAPATGGTSGTWAIDAGDFSLANLMITLKAGNTFAAFDITGTSGEWQTSRGLSHAALWYRGEPEPVQPIPLPAAGWMLVAGVGGLAALRRRRTR